MRTTSYRIVSLFIVVGALGMIGCATTPKVKSMVPKDAGLVFEPTGATLSVGHIQGGSESSAWKGSKIENDDFRLALIEALQQSNLFEETASDDGADYTLATTLLTQDQPAIGLAMTVHMAVRYVLTDSRTGEELFNDRIMSSYQAGMGEAFVGMVRVRKANEGAVRENLKQLLQQLASLSLQPH